MENTQPEVKKRGRQAGSTKQTTKIQDPAFGDFYIEIFEETSFNVMEKGKAKPIAYCSNLPNAIRRIIQVGMFSKDETFTLKEYINLYKSEFERIHKALTV